MTPESAVGALRRRGFRAELTEERGGDGAGVRTGISCELDPAQLPGALGAARDELGFDLLSAITATDEGDHFRLIYHLAQTGRRGERDVDGFLLIVVRAARGEHPDGPIVPSAVPLFPGANLQEREIFDLMGVRFRGHPNLTRVLTWTGFRGHPLRKDYVNVDEEIPWRLAGLRGPDGALLTEEDARRVEDERDVWVELSPDAPLAETPAAEAPPEAQP